MKDPAVLFYTQDFLTGTMLMTDEQVGQYIKLLCLQHQNGGLTERDMLKICGKYDEDIFKKFEVIEGKFCNKRMLLEANKRKKFTESRRANAKHMPKHMENENENEICNKKIEDELNISFADFWNLYDKKEDRIKCERKWKALTNKERELCIQAVPAYVTSTPDKAFRKHPATYLNNKSWENEIIVPGKSPPLTPKTYEEMLELTKNNPQIWKQYKAVKREGERKATFFPIQ